ncbi:MAG: response regulator transcription factor, partial [Endozoicomonas sp.]
ASIATAVEAMKQGAKDYLCKPADTRQILNALGIKQTPTEEKPEVPPTLMSFNQLEWEHLQKALQENGGNISATARSLGMHRRTLQRKLNKKPSYR